MAEKNKTNVMRILDQKKVPYTPYHYPHQDAPVDALEVSRMLGIPPEKVFKTLVAKGASSRYLVFVIPAKAELDLKKAARAAKEKSVEMIHVKELNAVTGYIRGGCSPIGMKKLFPTFFAEEAEKLSTILVSAGRIGSQVEATPEALLKLTAGSFADLTVEKEGEAL